MLARRSDSAGPHDEFRYLTSNTQVSLLLTLNLQAFQNMALDVRILSKRGISALFLDFTNFVNDFIPEHMKSPFYPLIHIESFSPVLYLSISPVHPVHPATPAGLLVASPSRPPAPGPPVAGAPASAPAGRRAVPGEGVPYPVEMWLQGIINGHIFLLLAIEAHLELLVTNAMPQRKMATAMAARSPSPRSSICATWPAVARGAPADGGRQEPAAAGGAPAAGPAGGGRSGRRRSDSTGPGCSAREERAWRRERERKKNTTENRLRQM